MNTKLLLTASALLALANVARAQGTAFTYQGRLDSSGAPAHGIYDLRFTTYDADSGGNLRGLLTNSAVAVSNGLFTTTLDFGFGVFNGGPRWLEIAVRSNATAAAFNTLAPRQAILPAPYAFWSANASQAVTVTGTVPGSGLNGVYSNPVSFNNPANGFAGDGGGLNNVNAAQLGGRSAAQFWQTGGNAGANPTNGAFLGTTDNQPVEIRANNRRALRLEPTADSANVIGGSASNVVSASVVGAVIAGGGAGAGNHNRVEADHAAVVGGLGNAATGAQSVIGGGRGNIAGGTRAVVGGGLFNQALGFASVIAGGNANQATNNWSTVGGGADNLASGYASVIPGGINNTASANFTAAMGYRAKANHNGAFVWADSQEADFNSTSTNQFNVRASGGVRFETGGAGLTVDGRSALLASAFGEPLVLSVNGTPALRIEPTTGTPNVIGGYDGNSVAPGIFGATVFGGGDLGIRQYPNRATTNFATVPGGLGNTASGFASTAMGAINTASGDHSTAMGFGTEASGRSSTAMGVFNSATGEASLVTGEESIAGGAYSTAMGYHTFAGGESSIASGYFTKASGYASTAMGSMTTATNNDSTAMGRLTLAGGSASTAIGFDTKALGYASTAIGSATSATNNDSIAMGRLTLAGGSASTAMGYRARALHHGSFVWADQQEADFDSTAANQFSLRASGGVRLNNDTSLYFGNESRQMLNLWSTEYAIGVQADAAYFRTANEFMWYRGGSHSDTFADSGGGDQLMRLGSTGNLVLAGTLSQGSDRHIKQDFTAVNPQAILDKVAALSIQTWTYTNDVSRRHLGPVAQDFHAAFGLNGADDKHIATVDADGVALAAIQGLNLKLEETRAENAALRRELSEIKQLLTKLSAKGN